MVVWSSRVLMEGEICEHIEILSPIRAMLTLNSDDFLTPKNESAVVPRDDSWRRNKIEIKVLVVDKYVLFLENNGPLSKPVVALNTRYVRYHHKDSWFLERPKYWICCANRVILNVNSLRLIHYRSSIFLGRQSAWSKNDYLRAVTCAISWLSLYVSGL